ncbi:MAG TPA: type VI secretion system accessory protein TagJ [Stellaceae bacterium]|jgi:type VI secretion system protein ImpE
MSQPREGAGELLRAGKLDAAIAAANAGLRGDPASLGKRILLAELLLFAGNLARADVILDAASQVDPTAAIAVAEFRQLLRAETARRQHRRDGRVPEFIGEPTPALRASLAASVATRAGDTAAARCAAEAEAVRPRVPGRAGDAPFDDFRDADDLYAGFFEILTTTGKYFWIPTERVVSIEFRATRRPRDLVWRGAGVSVENGPDGEVYLPAIYDADRPELGDEFRLGRATEWRGPESGPVVGIGQRVFLVGEEARNIMDLTTLQFGT